MAICKVIPSNPRIGIEIYYQGTLDVLFCRLFVADRATGAFPDNPASFWGVIPGASSDEEELGIVLKACGIQQDPIAWLHATPKDKAVQTILPWVRQQFLTKICLEANTLIEESGVTGQAPQVQAAGDVSTYDNPQHLFEAVLQWTGFTRQPDGKVTARIGE